MSIQDYRQDHQFEEERVDPMSQQLDEYRKMVHNGAIQQAIDKLRENSWFDIFGDRANHEIVQKLESLKLPSPPLNH